MRIYTILIVNDSPDQLKLLSLIIKKAGYRVLSAENGVEGLKIARRELPDLIISDVTMPKMDGIEFCREIRADEGLRSIPFLLVSALRKDTESVVEGIEAGADDYIEVPYESMRLIAKAAQLVERKLMSDALRESENRFRTMIENVTDIISIVALDGTILYESPSLEKIFGYEPAEIVGQNGFDFVHAEDIERVVAHFTLIIENVAADSLIEYRFRHKNDSWRTIESTGKSFVDPNNGIVIVVTSRDITERKKMENALREKEERYRNFIEQSTEGIWRIEFKKPLTTHVSVDDKIEFAFRHGFFAECNDAMARMYGLESARDLTGRSINEFLQPSDSANTDFLRAFMENGYRLSDAESRESDADGAEKYFLNNFIGIVENGNLASVWGIQRDVTESKRAEEALRQAEIKYRSLVEMSPGIVYLHEPNEPYSVVYVSPNINKFGYSPEDWYNKPKLWSSILHEDDRERAEREYASAVKQVLNAEFEYRIVGRDGEIFCVHDKGCFIFDDKGNKTGWQGVILDVTETKKLEDQLRQSQKLESVGRLAGGIAHDFNNMLTAINGYSELTLRQLGGDNPLRRNLEEIKAGERSAALTQQLLAFSRQQVLQSKIIDLNEVIADITQMLHRLIGENLSLQTILDPKLGNVSGDAGQLTQVIMNLAVNARDAMPNGGHLIIKTSNARIGEESINRSIPMQPGSYVLLSITDTGAGIESAAQEHIFEPFYTTKEVGKGTGLGLATVYGIVKQSGGYIWVESEIGIGTTFKVYLPRVDTEIDSEEANEAAKAVPQGRETILVVEDEDIVRTLTGEILEECGYRVIEAQSGIEALAIIEKLDCEIDLILTDIMMPLMGGRELAEKLVEFCPQMRVLFTSGYTDDEIVRHDVIKERTNFIEKPFTFEALAQKVRAVLDGES